MRQSSFPIAIFILSFFLSKLASPAYSQSSTKDSISFSYALKSYLPDYNRKANYAYQNKEYKKAEKLFDSLVTHQLSGTYFDDFKFSTLRGKTIRLNNIEKPIYLITYASWCIPGKQAIPAINKIADKYGEDLQIVVLFWDSKKIARKQAKPFNKLVKVVYIDESKNQSAFEIKQLKHSFGIKTCFLLNREKVVKRISKYPAADFSISSAEALEANINLIENDIQEYLLKQPFQGIESLANIH
ncbi:TlpA family protein disulfide reductase [Zunongwangia sp.]|uniref:TlpA family protein disulfide reductase n=1 Tax=Zunongwangia sp. TaxID=1965325 RepID=UPI003AA8A663